MLAEPRPRTRFARRPANSEVVREVLGDLAGYCVGRVSLRGGTMIVWLRDRRRHEPTVAVKLIGVEALRDNGVAGGTLDRGEIGPCGPWGHSLAAAEDRPELAEGAQLNLWVQGENYPRFQAIARHIRVFQGAALAQPDSLWNV